MVLMLWERSGSFLISKYTLYLYNPTIVPSIYPREIKIYVSKKAHTRMLTAALFIIAKNYSIGINTNCIFIPWNTTE